MFFLHPFLPLFLHPTDAAIPYYLLLPPFTLNPLLHPVHSVIHFLYLFTLSSPFTLPHPIGIFPTPMVLPLTLLFPLPITHPASPH